VDLNQIRVAVDLPHRASFGQKVPAPTLEGPRGLEKAALAVGVIYIAALADLLAPEVDLTSASGSRRDAGHQLSLKARRGTHNHAMVAAECQFASRRG